MNEDSSKISSVVFYYRAIFKSFLAYFKCISFRSAAIFQSLTVCWSFFFTCTWWIIKVAACILLIVLLSIYSVSCLLSSSSFSICCFDICSCLVLCETSFFLTLFFSCCLMYLISFAFSSFRRDVVFFAFLSSVLSAFAYTCN